MECFSLKNLSLKQSLASLMTVFILCFLNNTYADDANKSSFSNSLIEDNGQETFLSPDVAFKLDLSALDANNIKAMFTVAPGYYLYNKRLKFEIQLPSSAIVDSITLPAGEIKDDPNFGKQEVYHHDFTANIKLTGTNNGNVTILATYQGCSEKGLCYAPIKKNISVDLPTADNGTNTLTNTGLTNENDTDSTTRVLKSGNLWLVIAGFFVAGLLLSLTPCVLPMIPILSSIIVGSQSKQLIPSKLHTFGLSVAYVLGMALSYTLAGIAAGLSGNLLSQSLQNPLVLGVTALVFVSLSFSMFGFYELKLSASFESKMLNASNKLKGGEFLGVFIMGVLSALIVSPCVAAPLAGALIYIGQTHNVLLGGIGLFALAIGMGMPLLLIGASAGSLLPKAGGWMTIVRNFFGVMMLAMAAFIVWPVLPQSITAPVNKLLGFNDTHHLPFTRVKTIADLDAAIKAANGKPVMLDFYADWCTSCKEMEKLTFNNAKVKTALQNTVLLQADVTENNDGDQALLKHFGLFGPPGIIFFDKNGQEIKAIRTIGFQDANRFYATLSKR